jgi:hypothetical protein
MSDDVTITAGWNGPMMRNKTFDAFIVALGELNRQFGRYIHAENKRVDLRLCEMQPDDARTVTAWYMTEFDCLQSFNDEEQLMTAKNIPSEYTHEMLEHSIGGLYRAVEVILKTLELLRNLQNSIPPPSEAQAA